VGDNQGGGTNNSQANLSPEPIEKRNGSALIRDTVEGLGFIENKANICASGVFLIGSSPKKWVKFGQSTEEK
jgi:hypothetical protein